MNKPADACGAQSSSRPEKWLADTSGVLIPFRRAAKRPSARRHPRPRPCSSTQTRPLGAKRKYSIVCSEALTNWHWGAKRARSAVPRPNNSGSTCSCARDWADLGYGPAGLIAELLLASDVADYVRFRAVCRRWRQCSPDPRAAAAGGGLQDARFLPRRWIMLDKALAGAGACRHHRFLNVSTGECLRMDLPELSEHRFLAATPEGLLLLLHEPTTIARLLNPLTRQLVDLPTLAAFVEDGDGHDCCDDDEPEERGPFVQAAGLVTEDDDDGSIVGVAVSFIYPMKLAFAKPGDASWTVVNEGMYINLALSFAGRFYCATGANRGVNVMVLNTTTTSDQDQQQPPRLVMVTDPNKSFWFSLMAHGLHLVDNGGELVLVHRTCGQDHRKYNVYRLDLEAGILIPVNRLNGRAVFMGTNRAISVSVEAFPYVSADTIYLGYDCDINTQEYNIADGSRCSRTYGRSARPDTIVKSHCHTFVQSLCYCIQNV